jgi:membrane protease YdiL (CAAX protease family)
MINWRLASVPVLKSNSLAILRGLNIAWPSSIAIPRARTADRSVAWSWSDLGRVAIMTGLIVAGGTFTLVLLGLALSVGFTLAEGFGGIPLGTFDRITSFCTPYSAAGLTLIGGSLLYGAVAFSVAKYSVIRYRLSWSALGFVRLSRTTLGRTAALFIPIALGGVLVVRVEAALLGGLSANPQIGFLTRGVPALPGNFLMLFLVLVVIMPIIEEMFFRGFLYRLLRGHFSVWAAAPISAAVFAALHGVPTLFPWLFYMGVVYAVLAERTGSIWAGVVVHALANGLVLAYLIVLLCGW